MGDEELPKRMFVKGERKQVAFRLPTELIDRLNEIAEESGWTLTDVAQTGLDFYAQRVKPKSKGKP